MRIIKAEIFNKKEQVFFFLVYTVLFCNAFITHDSLIALISAFCGITYTILAGKGFPVCYLIGVIGSAFYSYLAYKNALWGNLLLYAGYYIPMQIAGYFQWNKNLQKDKKEIVKSVLSFKQSFQYFFVTIVLTIITILSLFYFGDKSPIIDGITAIFSILGMFLTVKRCVEQWVVWILVNGLSLIMWLKIALCGEKVYSTVVMWFVYFILAIYFYIVWKKEIKANL